MAFGTTPADSNNIPIGSVYVPGTGFKAIQGGSPFTDASSNDSSPVRFELGSPSKLTYVSSIFGLVPPATATDIFTLTGSSTKTVKIVRVEFSMTASAIGISIGGYRRASVDTGGTTTTTNLFTMPMDSSDTGATASILAYSANPTINSTIGAVFIIRYSTQAATATTPTPIFVMDWGNVPGQMPVLRGTSEQFAINLNSATATSPVANISIIWTEE